MRRRDILAGPLAVALAPRAVGAADYPDRPVRVIVPFEAGAPDLIARIVAQQLGAQLGRPFVTENRPGANGTIGTGFVARAAPDGTTLLIVSSSFAVNPSLYRSLPYDVTRDFIPVSELCDTEALIIGVNPALPVHTLAELIDYARRAGDTLSFASPGTGNVLHLAAALFNATVGAHMVHVPYRGAGPAISALLAGDVGVMFMTAPLSLPYIRAGTIRALAYTGDRRASFLPDVPSVVEAGEPDLRIDGGWYGLFAPAHTPDAIIARLEAEVAVAVRAPVVVERFESLGITPIGGSGAAFRAVLARQIDVYADLLRLAGVRPE